MRPTPRPTPINVRSRPTSKKCSRDLNIPGYRGENVKNFLAVYIARQEARRTNARLALQAGRSKQYEVNEIIFVYDKGHLVEILRNA